MRRSTAVSVVCAALLMGVVLGRLGVPGSGWLVLPAAVLALSLWPTRLRVGAMAALAVAVGLWRFQVDAAAQAQLTNLIGETVTLTAVISDDPGYDPRGFMEFKLGDLRLEDAPLPGSIGVRMYQTNLHRGYTVQVSGKLRPGFGTIPAELSYPQLVVRSTQQSWLEHIRQRFFAGMKTALPDTVASFGLGILVGVRSMMSDAMRDQLSLVGVSHLVAVSGYNLTIMVAAAHRLLERFGRGVALVSSLWLIGGFLVVTGASASIVRASCVSVLALLAAFYGRRPQPMALILIVAAGTAAYHPGYLTDLGWLLSFIAFFGVMVVAPAVMARLGNPKWVAVQLFVESSVAHVLTIPLIMFIFGSLSIVAPISNLMVLPLIPLAMLTAFIAGIAGAVAPAFAGWVAWPANLIISFILAVIGWFAHLPWAGVTAQIGWVTMLLGYGGILLITLALKRVNYLRQRAELASLTDPLMRHVVKLEAR